MPAATMRILAWAAPNQAQLIQETARSTGAQVVAIASPTPQGAPELSKALDTRRVEDLRNAIHQGEFDVLWLAAPEPASAEVRRLIRELKVRTVSCEPQVGDIGELLADPQGGIGTSVVPLMRRSPGYRAAAQTIPQFGEAQCVNVFFRSGPGQGTLFARLYDAMDVLLDLCGEIETINAGLAGPLANVPDNLHGLRGHMSGNLRFKPNRCACVALSDGAGTWFRGVTVLGEGGCLRISDAGFEWIGPDGRVLDQHQSEKANILPGELIGMQIRRLQEGLDSGEQPDNISLMSMCESARLSCLTGQDEAPAKLAEMMSRP